MQMREIKFRAWDKKLEKMFYDVVFHNGKTFACNQHGNAIWIPMQYTGLKDKNDKEIYEGDLIKIVDNNGVCKFEYICEVVFDVGCFSALMKSRKRLTHSDCSYSYDLTGKPPLYHFDSKQIEIINNTAFETKDKEA